MERAMATDAMRRPFACPGQDPDAMDPGYVIGDGGGDIPLDDANPLRALRHRRNPLSRQRRELRLDEASRNGARFARQQSRQQLSP